MAGVKRFSSDIENKLNKLFYMGYVEFERWEILCWFGVEKLPNLFGQAFLNNGHLGLMMVIARLLILFADGTTATQKYILIRSDRIQDLTEFSE